MRSKLSSSVLETTRQGVAEAAGVGDRFRDWLTTALGDFGFSVLLIGDRAPDFYAETTIGPIHFHEWIDQSWCMLFSHPKCFTPVCTTELGYMARLKPEFDRRNCKVISLSVDGVGDHHAWGKDIADVMGAEPNFPMIGDRDLKVARLYGMLPATDDDDAAGRTAEDNKTVRTVHIINPEKRIAAMLSYPMSSGRNFLELLRLLDSIQLSSRHPVSTPVQWRPGQEVIISSRLTNDEAKAIFPAGWTEAKPYLRFVTEPREE
jgi:alkyl hydroperoxide reductase subunit AhpC